MIELNARCFFIDFACTRNVPQKIDELKTAGISGYRLSGSAAKNSVSLLLSTEKLKLNRPQLTSALNSLFFNNSLAKFQVKSNLNKQIINSDCL
jgi:hypothetical protein